MFRLWRLSRQPLRACLLALWVPLLLTGCRTPCQQFGDLICQQLSQKHTLCTIAREESNRKSVTYRRCRALTSTWQDEGKRELSHYIKRYQQYRDRVGRKYTMHRGLKLMEQEHKRFRKLIRKLLGLPASAPSPTPKAPPRARPRK